MTYTVFIFARGGSKGLPNKNIRSFCGKPLIQWTIELAFSMAWVDRVIVSTDSQAIGSVASSCGADVPFMRPKNLASDTSPEWLSWRHALEYLVSANKKLPEGMVILPVTAPMRKIEDVESCTALYQSGDIDAVVTVTQARRNPFFNMVYKSPRDDVELVSSPSKNIVRRQDAPVVWDMATVAYVVNPDFVLSKNFLFEGRVKGVEVPNDRAIDIDTLLDFEIAEFLMEKRINE